MDNKKRKIEKEIEEKKKDIIKQKTIDNTVDKIKKEFFSKKYGRKINKDTLSYNNTKEEEPKNLCLICNIDMGPHNPRQLCGKTKCTTI